MSSLLGNLVAQVAQSAMNGGQQQSSQQSQGGMGGLLAGVLGSALGGGQQSGGGMGDIIGSVLSSQMNGNSCSSGGSGIGSMLGSVLGSSMGGGQQQSGGNSNGNTGMLIAMIMPMVLSWIQSKGGLGGALSQIQSMGLADQASSWMSVDQPNTNLDENQVNELFGADKISQIASKAGIEEGVVAQGIGALLPEIMNQLTPDGGMEKENEANLEISDILSQLGGLL